MDIRDKITATLRTLWPAAIAAVVTWLIAAVQPLGLSLDGELATAAVGWVLFAVVYLAGRWLESRRGNSALAQAARWVAVVLLGSARQPVYVAGSTARAEVQR